MKNLNRKGFTLIELLAVITIMGILMLVAIPAVSRTIENSRRDTFADVAKTYVNAVRNSVLADELKCDTATENKTESVGATGMGVYYFAIDSDDDETRDIVESGGKSSWSNARVTGYVVWKKAKKQVASNNNNNNDNENENNTPSTPETKEETKTDYYVILVDEGRHGIDAVIAENDVARSVVKTATAGDLKAGDEGIYTKVTAKFDGETIRQCKLK